MRLESDFRDYYDHWFDSTGDRVFQRMSRTDMSKRQQFELLSRVGFAVPRYGVVRDPVMRLAGEWLVVYKDEFAHCGEGKILCQNSLARFEYPNLLASKFIPTTEDYLLQSASRRILVVGDRVFWLKYVSDGWMSNHAKNVEVHVINELPSRENFAKRHKLDFLTLKNYPLFAIDLVSHFETKEVFAIDFNSAPGLKWTGIEEHMTAKECFEAIARYVEKNL